MYGSHYRGGLMGSTHRHNCAMTSRTKSNIAGLTVGSQGVPHDASARTTPTTGHRQIPRRRPHRGHLPGIGLLEKLALHMAGSLPGTDPSWSEEQSRRPRTTPTKTPQRIAQVVVALRQTLAQHGKGCGAAAVQQALAPQGIEPVPSQRTIYRILHRYAKEVPSTHHHHTAVHKLGHVLPVLTCPHRQGKMATGGEASWRLQRTCPGREKQRCARQTAWTSRAHTLRISCLAVKFTW